MTFILSQFFIKDGNLTILNASYQVFDK